MKIFITLLLGLLFSQGNYLFSQSTLTEKKFIEVTGSAEKTVVPDEIELEIVLTEYTKDGIVIKLENIEKDFYSTLKRNDIDTQALKLNSLESNYWWNWWSGRGKSLKTKSFKISVAGNINFLKLVEDLNKKWVESIDIVQKKNKNIQDYRKEVKILALRAAKDKARYLLESIDEHLGGVISVEEISDQTNAWFSGRNLLSNTIASSSNNTEEVKNVSEIRIRYEFKVKFEIK